LADTYSGKEVVVAEVQKFSLEGLEEELRANFRKVYLSKEMVQFWGAEKYPGPFVFFNREATRDTIVHFADGIGDINLLYRDEAYAKKTKYGKMQAPPAFVFSVCSLAQAPVVKGTLIGWDGGYEVEWFRPISQGSSLDWRLLYPSDVEAKVSKMAGKSLVISTECEFMDENQEPVAISKEWCISVDTSTAVMTDKYSNIRLHEYTAGELKNIYDAQDNEVARGSQPRYWEDVNIGDPLTPIARGPMGLMEMIGWLAGCGSPISKPEQLWRRIDMYDRKVLDPVTKSYINLELVHMDDRVGKMVGVPAAYDFGVQRVSWLSVLMTNWMGDDGFLWKLRGELRRFNITGDTTWLKGKVVRKFMDAGKCCVEIDCWGENQRGEITMPGNATVILPSREHGPVVYPSPRRIA
jgi:acyl dehydratase